MLCKRQPIEKWPTVLRCGHPQEKGRQIPKLSAADLSDCPFRRPGQVRSAQVSIAGQVFTITQAGAGSTLPVIASASVAYGPSQIAQNTWIAINGSNLVPPDTSSGGVFWSDALQPCLRLVVL